MTGLVKMGTGAGQFTFPILASFLIANFGWKIAFISMGSFGFIVLFIIAQFLRRDPESYNSSFDGNLQNKSKSQNQGFSFSKSFKTYELWLICLTNFIDKKQIPIYHTIPPCGGAIDSFRSYYRRLNSNLYLFWSLFARLLCGVVYLGVRSIKTGITGPINLHWLLSNKTLLIQELLYYPALRLQLNSNYFFEGGRHEFKKQQLNTCAITCCTTADCCSFFLKSYVVTL